MERHEAIRILGLSAMFTPAELTHAYRAQVRANHPDLHGLEKEETMRRINQARDVLSKTADRQFGIAGKETWSDIRGWRAEAPANQVVKPTRVQTPDPDNGMFARFVKRRKSGAV